MHLPRRNICLCHRIFAAFYYCRFDTFGFVGFKCTTAETDGELVEVAFEGVGGGGMVCHGFVVGMKEFATLAGGGVGDPDAGGVALEVDQADAGGCHLVVERLHAVTDFE